MRTHREIRRVGAAIDRSASAAGVGVVAAKARAMANRGERAVPSLANRAKVRTAAGAAAIVGAAAAVVTVAVEAGGAEVDRNERRTFR